VQVPGTVRTARGVSRLSRPMKVRRPRSLVAAGAGDLDSYDAHRRTCTARSTIRELWE
jgi:hypothetical protein